MSMRPVCIRGLSAFKKGCPENESCPAWKSLLVATRGNPLEKEMRAQCIDMWIWEFSWAILGAIEALTAESQTLRNNLCQPGGVPKPDPALVDLVQIIRRRLNELPDHKTQQLKED